MKDSLARSQWRPKTLEAHHSAWRRIEVSGLAEWPLKAIDVSAVRKVLARYAESAARQTLSVLRSIFVFAASMGFDGADPTRAVRIPRSEKRQNRYLTASEVGSLAMELGSQGDTVRVLAFTGLRVGELSGLRVGDWDSTRRRLHVRRAISFVNGHARTHSTKTGAGLRTVPVPQRVAHIFDSVSTDQEHDAPLWRSPQGKIWTANNWRRRSGWSKAVETLCLEPLRLHDLRHTYASLSRSAGADIATLKSCMGHSTIKHTIDLYGGLYDDDLDTFAAALDGL
ncbi:tyrosine-type recombinase/integrase [Arthrobacter rhombi]|uniref:tyrosine-type recombinase/integrase n=1 Tax=Arthrobacter rhombi TaxID=71253 RepID=UPI003FD1DF57